MGRKSPTIGQKPVIPSLHERMSAVLQEAHRRQQMTHAEFWAFVRKENPNLLLPPIVDEMYMTGAEHGALTSWSRIARGLDAGLQQIADENSWVRVVASEYANELQAQSAEVNDARSVATFSDRVLQRATARIQAARKPIIHYIPCYLIDDPHPEAFRIGPVEFVPGSQLAAHVAAAQGGQPAWLEEYVHATEGKDDQNPAKAAARWTAKDVRDMSKNPWVAVVEFDGYEPVMSKRRANDAVRLALASIALLFAPGTAAKTGLVNEWGPPRVRRTMAQIRGNGVFGGSSNDVPQARFGRAAKDVAQDYREFLDWAGELIGESLTCAATGTSLRESWLNALHWYYTGCLEASDARAVICFSTAIESMTHGHGKEDITACLEAVFGTGRTTIVAPSLGWSLERTVEEMYGSARSEVVHGGRFVIFGEYHVTRGVTAELCRLALMISHEHLRAYETKTQRHAAADRKEFFLKWLQAQDKQRSMPVA